MTGGVTVREYEMAEPVGMRVDGYDNDGNIVTVYSTTGKPQTEGTYAQVLNAYNTTGKEPSGFVVLRKGALTERLRRAFEDVNAVVQPGLEMVGRGVGQLAGMPPPSLNAYSPEDIERAGVNLEPSRRLAETGGDVGAAVGRFAGEGVKTPSRAGTTLGLILAARGMAPITSAAGPISYAALLGNMLKTGALGTAGSTTARLATGEKPTPGSVGTEFALAALSGGFQSVMSHFVARYIQGDKADKVAKDVFDAIAERYPNVAADPGIVNIAGAHSANVSRVVQRGVEGLRGSLESVSNNFTDDIMRVLPSTLKAGEKATLRAKINGIIRTQNKLLDNVNNDAAYAELRSELIGKFDENVGRRVGGRIADLKDYIAQAFPRLKDPLPLQQRVAGVIQKYDDEAAYYNQGAKVLAYIKEASGDEGFNPQKFADVIRGVYQDPRNPLLEKVGSVLGGGRPLTQMPMSPTAEELERHSLASKALNFIRNEVPGVKYLPGVGARSQQRVPWPAPEQPLPPLASFGTLQVGTTSGRAFTESESGQAMRRFVEGLKKERK